MLQIVFEFRYGFISEVTQRLSLRVQGLSAVVTYIVNCEVTCEVSTNEMIIHDDIYSSF